jgi:hypothetical protein
MSHPLSNSIAELKKIKGKIYRLQNEDISMERKTQLWQAGKELEGVIASMLDEVCAYHKKCIENETNE